MSPSPALFDRALVRQHIARAAPGFARHSVLFDECAEQIRERVSEVKRKFVTALDLSPFPFWVGADRAAITDTDILPCSSANYDLIVSNLDLHWVNDVPGVLTQIRATLKPEGMFIAALVGERSLHELRSCLLDAELAVTGGVSPRLSPTIDLLSSSQLMQRAGFALPVADKETVTLLYTDMFALMRDLRGMGQTNAHNQRLRRPTRRAVFFEAARLYQERFGDAAGRIPATIEVIYLHGWG